MDVAEIVLFSRNKYIINYEMVCTFLNGILKIVLLNVLMHVQSYNSAVDNFVIQSIT